MLYQDMVMCHQLASVIRLPNLDATRIAILIDLRIGGL